MKVATRILLATLAAGSLWAEESRLGVQFQALSPRGELKPFVDSKVGPGAGLHLTIDLGDGQVLRPRLDYASFPEVMVGASRQHATALSLGTDYLLFSEWKPEGLYLALGLAATRWSLHTTPATVQSRPAAIKASLSFGIGCLWTETLGTELRYSHTRVTQTFSTGTVQAEITLRF